MKKKLFEDFNLSSLFRKTAFNKAFSLLLAFSLWFYVVYAIDNDDIKTIRDVPITIDESALSNLGLSVVDGDDATVTVQVQGKRYDIGNLEAEDITVRAALGTVKGAGRYELALEPVLTGGEKYSVEIAGSKSVWIVFDRELSKTMEVTPNVNGISVPEGYVLGSIEVSPAEITVRGPENDINKIARAEVAYTADTPLTVSQTLSAEILFYDREGNPVSSDYIIKSVSYCDIVIPVKKMAELPLTLSFTNTPTGLDPEDLNYTLSNETIQVAAPEDQLRSYYEILVGNINFETLDLTEQNVYSFEVELPNGFINVDNIETVVAEFDNTNFSAQYLNLDNFVLVNVPSGYEADTTTTAINNVKIIGDAAVLQNIRAGDFVVEIDLSEREVHLGQYEMPVSIYAPGKGLVWAVGGYSAVISVRSAE